MERERSVESRKLIIKKKLLYSFILYLFLLPILYFFINFDSSQNLDYGGYKDNYENLWSQFELGYTALEHISRLLKLAFEDFWLALVCIQLILIALLYSNPYVFLFAFPNLLFLSQGLLGTQVRFGIAALLCLVVFKFFINKKHYYFYSMGPTLFHNGTFIFLFLSFFLKKMLNINESLLYKKNARNLLFCIVILVAISALVNYILLAMGYYYYVDSDSKHMVARSTSSIIYMFSVLLFVFALLNSKHKPVKYASMAYLGALMLILSLVFYKYSIISGRYNLVYMLVEPFILYSYYKTIGNKNWISLFSFITFFTMTSSKLLLLNLTF